MGLVSSKIKRRSQFWPWFSRKNSSLAYLFTCHCLPWKTCEKKCNHIPKNRDCALFGTNINILVSLSLDFETKYCLNYLTLYIYTSRNSIDYISYIFVNLKKAFYTGNHIELIENFEKYEMKGIAVEVIRSFC